MKKIYLFLILSTLSCGKMILGPLMYEFSDNTSYIQPEKSSILKNIYDGIDYNSNYDWQNVYFYKKTCYFIIPIDSIKKCRGYPNIIYLGSENNYSFFKFNNVKFRYKYEITNFALPNSICINKFVNSIDSEFILFNWLRSVKIINNKIIIGDTPISSNISNLYITKSKFNFEPTCVNGMLSGYERKSIYFNENRKYLISKESAMLKYEYYNRFYYFDSQSQKSKKQFYERFDTSLKSKKYYLVPIDSVIISTQYHGEINYIGSENGYSYFEMDMKLNFNNILTNFAFPDSVCVISARNSIDNEFLNNKWLRQTKFQNNKIIVEDKVIRIVWR